MEAVLQGLTEDGIQDQRGQQLARSLAAGHLEGHKANIWQLKYS